MSQPPGNSDEGVILTINMNSKGDRCAIVLPVYINPPGSDGSTEYCSDAVASFIAGPLPTLLDCIASDTYVSSIGAEGMSDGNVPSRTTFAPDAQVGMLTAPSAPCQVTGLITFYAEPPSFGGGRIRQGRNFIPGVPVSMLNGDYLLSSLTANYLNLVDELFNGYPSAGFSGSNWYRCVSAPRPRPTVPVDLETTSVALARGYVCTQRRRLIPRF